MAKHEIVAISVEDDTATAVVHLIPMPDPNQPRGGVPYTRITFEFRRENDRWLLVSHARP